MSNSPKPTVLQYLGLVAAGLASFYLAFQLGRPSATADGEVDLLRTSRSATASNTEVVSPPVALGRTVRVSAADQERTRLDPLVLRDAFLPLDASVTVDSLLPPPSKAHSVNPALARQQKKKEPAAPPPISPPPPVQEAVAPPPAPTAPPLPFKFLGALQGERIGNGEMTAFVSGASAKVLLIRAGDVIDNTYKVKSMGAGKIEFIYLPLQTTQSLTMEK